MHWNSELISENQTRHVNTASVNSNFKHSCNARTWQQLYMVWSTQYLSAQQPELENFFGAKPELTKLINSTRAENYTQTYIFILYEVLSSVKDKNVILFFADP